MQTITYADIRQKMDGEPFPITIADDDEIRAVIHAVNQGIDAHLEACNCPDRGDRYEQKNETVGGKVFACKLACVVSVESFPVLLRRLWEMDGNEAAETLLSDILSSLGFEDADVGCFEIISPVDEPTARPNP
jgi:hypothetical protein